MYKLMTAAVAAIVIGGGAQATTVDFSDLAANTALGIFDFGDGITGIVTADGTRAISPDVAVVFDTDATDTADADLESPFTLAGDDTVTRSFGNAIIIQENPADADGNFIADDVGGGGTIEFAFNNIISLFEVSLLDARLGSTVTLFNGADEFALTTTVSADTTDAEVPNLFTVLDFGGALGNRFVVDFNGGSGAVGEFTATLAPAPAPVPLPASALLLIAGLGGLGAMKRRKKS